MEQTWTDFDVRPGCTSPSYQQMSAVISAFWMSALLLHGKEKRVLCSHKSGLSLSFILSIWPFWGTHCKYWGCVLITADLDKHMMAAYQPNKSEAGESLRDMDRRECLTFASQLPALVRSQLTGWSSAAAAAVILHFLVTAAFLVSPRPEGSNSSWYGALEHKAVNFIGIVMYLRNLVQ